MLFYEHRRRGVGLAVPAPKSGTTRADDANEIHYRSTAHECLPTHIRSIRCTALNIDSNVHAASITQSSSRRTEIQGVEYDVALFRSSGSGSSSVKVVSIQLDSAFEASDRYPAPVSLYLNLVANFTYIRPRSAAFKTLQIFGTQEQLQKCDAALCIEIRTHPGK